MSDQMGGLRPAYYAANVSEFLCTNPDTVYGILGRYHGHTQELAQKAAWLEQIELLQKGLSPVPNAWIALELAVPRMGKRADAVVVLDGIIFVIEFKIGAEIFTSAAIEQVTDYSLDLKNFHA